MNRAFPVFGGSRFRQVGWLVALVLCGLAFVALSFRVNAVKSEVRLAERRIIDLQSQRQQLEVEFQSRASQRQLADWNRIEFGYHAPRPGQYLQSSRQLASLGQPMGENAPEPIRVARASAPAQEPGALSFVSDFLSGDEALENVAKRGPGIADRAMQTGADIAEEELVNIGQRLIEQPSFAGDRAAAIEAPRAGQ